MGEHIFSDSLNSHTEQLEPSSIISAPVLIGQLWGVDVNHKPSNPKHPKNPGALHPYNIGPKIGVRNILQTPIWFVRIIHAKPCAV